MSELNIYLFLITGAVLLTFLFCNLCILLRINGGP